jgi:hypothetical protein
LSILPHRICFDGTELAPSPFAPSPRNFEAECPLHVLSGGHEGLAACVSWSLTEPLMLASGGEDARVVVWAPTSLAVSHSALLRCAFL